LLKEPAGIDVLTAARNRISWTFDTFERIYLSFSAGKDSTVMLHLVMEEAIKRNRKIGVLIVDLEAQYKLTMEHAQTCVDMYREHIELFWVCLPIHLRNAVSVYEPFWMCWDPNIKEDAWVRQPPVDAIQNETYFPWFEQGMEFEEFVPLFGDWYSQGKECACFVGIRTDESLNRFRTIVQSKKETHSGLRWTSKVIGTTFNVYPIYDWKGADIWTYHARTKLPHNKLYDLMQKAGVPMGNMRICQPYGDDQRKGLWLFHLIEPETWSRVVARVNGANGGALYVQEWGNINGYRGVTKPPGHTWQSFAKLLINSMPPKTTLHYRNKVILWVRWWATRGYPDGIPDEAAYEMEAARKAPSWRRVCKTLLRNDYWCKGIGYTQHRSAAYQKYLDLMERRKHQWTEQGELLAL
jgi:predicted phosphoadenosine phosphosulfate sulfurtransferase